MGDTKNNSTGGDTMTTQDHPGWTLTEASDRYKQTLIFNNDLMKRNYPDWYDFNTKMRADKKRHFGVSEPGIATYEERRRREYDKKFKAYCDRLDAQVEPAVKRYVVNIRAAFGYD